MKKKSSASSVPFYALIILSVLPLMPGSSDILKVACLMTGLVALPGAVVYIISKISRVGRGKGK